MTRQAAVDKAREDSKAGYVQHVNLTVRAGGYSYAVSDWYDGDATVASFEGGRLIGGTADDAPAGDVFELSGLGRI